MIDHWLKRKFSMESVKCHIEKVNHCRHSEKICKIIYFFFSGTWRISLIHRRTGHPSSILSTIWIAKSVLSNLFCWLNKKKKKKNGRSSLYTLIIRDWRRFADFTVHKAPIPSTQRSFFFSCFFFFVIHTSFAHTRGV